MTAETLEASLNQLLLEIRECRHCEANRQVGRSEHGGDTVGQIDRRNDQTTTVGVPHSLISEAVFH